MIGSEGSGLGRLVEETRMTAPRLCGSLSSSHTTMRGFSPFSRAALRKTDAALGHIASAARDKGIVVVDADRRKLDNMSRTH